MSGVNKKSIPSTRSFETSDSDKTYTNETFDTDRTYTNDEPSRTDETSRTDQTCNTDEANDMEEVLEMMRRYYRANDDADAPDHPKEISIEEFRSRHSEASRRIAETRSQYTESYRKMKEIAGDILLRGFESQLVECSEISNSTEQYGPNSSPSIQQVQLEEIMRRVIETSKKQNAILDRGGESVLLSTRRAVERLQAAKRDEIQKLLDDRIEKRNAIEQRNPIQRLSALVLGKAKDKARVSGGASESKRERRDGGKD